MSEGIEVRPDAVAVLDPPEHIVRFAVEASLNSPCQSKRGVAIFDGNELITTGWNHKPRGFDCDGSDACKATCGHQAIHAEQMALMHGGLMTGCDMLHVKTANGVLVPSGGPSCLECSKLILGARLAGMWLYHAGGWKRYTAAEFHRLTLQAVAPDPRDAELAALREQVARLRTAIKAGAFLARQVGASIGSHPQNRIDYLKRTIAETYDGLESALNATPAPAPRISAEALIAEAQRLQQFAIDSIRINRGCRIGTEILATLASIACGRFTQQPEAQPAPCLCIPESISEVNMLCPAHGTQPAPEQPSDLQMLRNLLTTCDHAAALGGKRGWDMMRSAITARIRERRPSPAPSISPEDWHDLASDCQRQRDESDLLRRKAAAFDWLMTHRATAARLMHELANVVGHDHPLEAVEAAMQEAHS